MTEKNLTDKSTSNADKFKAKYTDKIFEDLYKDDRFEFLFIPETLKDLYKEDTYKELIKDPAYKLIMIDGNEDEKKLDLSSIIRDFFAEIRFGDVQSKYKTQGLSSFVFTCDEGEQCLLIQPTIKQTNELMNFVDIMTQKVDALYYGEYVIQNCWISGDDEIRKDEKYHFEIGMIGVRMIKIRVAHIKKN